MSFLNPISPIQSIGTSSVPRNENYGTTFSNSIVGGYMQVNSLNDLIYSIPSGQTGNIEYSGNTIPINFVKGIGTSFSRDVVILNSDNQSSGRRKIGMLVYVREQEQLYQYTNDNFLTLWNAATAATGTVVVSDFGTTVNNSTAAGQNFINSWTASTIDGYNGVVRSNAVWKKYYGTNLALTGGSFNSITGVLTLTNITGGTQTLLGFGSGGGGGAGITGGTFNQSTLGLDLTSSAGTITINGVTGLYISAGTYSSATSTILLYNSTGGTINVTGITATGGGGVTTTGGTYTAGTATFTNSTGGTFSVTGFSKYFVTGSTPTGVTLNNGDRWFDTNTGIEVVWITDTDGSQWIQPTQGGGGSSTSGNYLPLSGGTVTGGTIFQSGLTANTISATTYQNLPFSGTVGGTGSPYYITRWLSATDIYDSRLYDDGTFLGLDITGPTYGEAVSLQTSNRGILIDDTYIIQTGGNSLAFTIGYDYSSWGSSGELAIGTRAPLLNSTGSGNIAIGDKALATNTTGNDNIAIGSTGALFKNDTGNENLSIGRFALTNNIVGSNNIALGTESLFNNNSNRNIAIGSYAGYSNTNYDKNIYIGYSAGYSNDGESNIFIGYGAGSSETTTNNKLIIGDTIYGDLGTKFIGINQPIPVTTLDVSGTTRISGGLTASTVSATTYFNLPTDVRVTGSTYSNNTFTFTNNTGGTFSVLFNTVTGLTVNGGLSATTISATTYQNLPFSGTVTGSGTTRFIPSWSNSSNLNSTIIYNATSAIGIATTSPLATLHVSGTTIISSGLTATTISATTYQNLPQSINGGGTTSYIPKWTGSTGIGDSIIYDTGTNIGIGLTNPGYKLEVKGKITASGLGNAGEFLSIDTAPGGATVGLNAQFGTGIAQLVTYSNSPIVIATNNTERIRITNDGNFGIGTASPSEKLQVSGNVLISGGLTATTISATTYQNLPSIIGLYLPLSGGTMTGGLVANSGVTANTVSQVNYIDFTTGSTNPSQTGGRIFFDNVTKALSYYDVDNNLVPVAMGQQLYTRVYNGTGVQIDKGKVITITGTTNGLPSIKLATNNHALQSPRPIGVTSENIPNGGTGLVLNNGILSGITLNTFANGDVLYLSDTTPGGYVNSTSSLSFTARTNEIGYVLQTGTTTGKIYVNINNEDSNLTLTDIERNILEGNVISGGVYEYTGMTVGTGATINVALVRGWIVKNTYSFATLPDVTNVYYSGGTNIPLTNLASADATFILINSASTLVQQTSFPTPQQRRENIFLGKVVHPSRTSITSINQTVDFDVSPMAALRDLWTSLKLINQGIIVSPHSTTLEINTSAGTLWGNGIGWITNQLNPDSISISGTSPTTFQYRTQLGPLTGGSVTTGNTTTIAPGYYDLNGVVTAVGGGSNSSTNQRVFLFPTGLVRIQLGQQVYGNLAAAVAGSQTEQFTEYSLNRENGILIGIISVNKNATDLSNTAQAVFNLVSKFGEVLGGTGGLSTTTLQQAYDNSATPEIVTNSAEGALSIQNGTGAADNVTNLFEGRNTATSTTSFIRADGAFSGTSIFGTGLSATTISATTYQNIPIKYYAEFSGAPTISPIVLSTGSISIGDGAESRSTYMLSFGQNSGRNATGTTYSNFIGVNAGYDASGSSYSNFIGSGAGYGAINSSQSNFIGPSSGFFSTGVTQSFFVGYEAGRQSVNFNYSNVFGYQAGYGVTNATYTNFFGNQAGYQATSAQFSNFIGYAAGTSATNAQYSNFIGANAGLQASNASYSTLIGFNAGKFFTSNNIGSNNIIIGTNISLPSGTTNSLNIGGVLFGTGLYSNTGGNPLTTANGGKIGINVVSPTNTLDIGGSLLVTGTTFLGNGTFTKAGNAAGDILLDNSSTDTPGILFYYANNSNYGIDSWSGSFDVLSGQLLRITNKLNETGGAVKMAIDTTGNMVVTGFIKPSAWRAGQVVNDIMLSNTEVTISTTTIATSTSDTDFLTYSYTPLSSSSYIVIHYHLASFSFEGGTGNDSYFSRIKVDGTEITYSRQSTVNGNRTGVLFPLTGRYTNSNTTAKSIVVACRRDSADDNITIVNTATSMWLRITEIAR